MLLAILFTFLVDIFTYVSIIHPCIDEYRDAAIAAGKLAKDVEFSCHIVTSIAIVLVSAAALLAGWIIKRLAHRFLP